MEEGFFLVMCLFVGLGLWGIPQSTLGFHEYIIFTFENGDVLYNLVTDTWCTDPLTIRQIKLSELSNQSQHLYPPIKFGSVVVSSNIPPTAIIPLNPQDIASAHVTQ